MADVLISILFSLQHLCLTALLLSFINTDFPQQIEKHCLNSASVAYSDNHRRRFLHIHGSQNAVIGLSV